MLEDSKVTLSLEDFDRLRDAYKELEQLKWDISRCSDIEVTENENSELPDVLIKIDETRIKKIAVEYSCWRKDRFGWVDLSDVKDAKIVNEKGETHNIPEPEDLIAEINKLAVLVNNKGKYTVFASFSGHVNSISVRWMEGEWKEGAQYIEKTMINIADIAALNRLRDDLLELLTKEKLKIVS